jgi:hypothetical protein
MRPSTGELRLRRSIAASPTGVGRDILAIACLFISLFCLADTPGSFRGYLLRGINTRPGWIYVQSRNEMLRLVKVAGAWVHYAESVPEAERRGNPAESLQPGAEVRITADEDGHARWYAREVEILRVSSPRKAEK